MCGSWHHSYIRSSLSKRIFIFLCSWQQVEKNFLLSLFQLSHAVPSAWNMSFPHLYLSSLSLAMSSIRRPCIYLYDSMVIATTVTGLSLYQWVIASHKYPLKFSGFKHEFMGLCPVMHAYASVVSCVGTSWSRMVLTGLTWFWSTCVWSPSSSRLASACSQSSHARISEREKGGGDGQGHLRSRLRTGTRLLLPHSIGQIKSQGQPRFKSEKTDSSW